VARLGLRRVPYARRRAPRVRARRRRASGGARSPGTALRRRYDRRARPRPAPPSSRHGVRGVAATVLAAALAASVPATSIKQLVRATFRPRSNRGGDPAGRRRRRHGDRARRRQRHRRVSPAGADSPSRGRLSLPDAPRHAPHRRHRALSRRALGRRRRERRYRRAFRRHAAGRRRCARASLVGADTVFASDGARVTTTARDSGGRLIVDPPRSRVQH